MIGLEPQSGGVRRTHGAILATPRRSVKLWARLAFSTPLSTVARKRKLQGCAARNFSARVVCNGYLYVHFYFSFRFPFFPPFFRFGRVALPCLYVSWFYVSGRLPHFVSAVIWGVSAFGLVPALLCRCVPGHTTSLGLRFQEVRVTRVAPKETFTNGKKDNFVMLFS